MSYANRSYIGHPAASSRKSPIHNSPAQRDELIRVFNTALVSSKNHSGREFSSELYQLTETAPFKAILSAVRQLSKVQGIHERKAAELVIETFRRMDEIWDGYLLQEGLNQMKKPQRG